MDSDIVSAMKQGAQELAEIHFNRPDDDWQPVMFLQTPGKQIQVIGFDPRFLSGENEKDMLSLAIVEQIRQSEAEAVGLIISAWMVVGDKTNLLEQRIQPSQHPDRKETLVITETDEQGVRFHHAPIIRDGTHPPSLGAWEVGETGVMTGRFVEPIVEALKEVKASASNQSRPAGRDADGGNGLPPGAR